MPPLLRRPGAHEHAVIAGWSFRRRSRPSPRTLARRHAPLRPHPPELPRRRRRLPGRRRPGGLLAGGAGAAGGARRPSRPRPARPRPSPLGCLRPRRRPAGPARRRARPGRRRRIPRAAGAGTHGPSPPGASRPARSRRRARSPWPPTRSPGSAARDLDYVADLALLLLATNLFNLLDLRPGRVEKAFAGAARGALPRRLDGRPARDARPVHRPGGRRRRVHAARAGDARRHRLQPGRGAGRDLAARRPRRRRAAGRAGARRRAHDLRGVSVDLGDDRASFRCCGL